MAKAQVGQISQAWAHVLTSYFALAIINVYLSALTALNKFQFFQFDIFLEDHYKLYHPDISFDNAL